MVIFFVSCTVNLRKIEIAFLEDFSGPVLYQNQSDSLKNCQFHAFVIYRLGLPERTPFADDSD